MTYKHIESVTVLPPWFSRNKKFRYTLEIFKTDFKGRKGKTVTVVMMNPSYANLEVADKSVNFIEKLVFEKDYHEFDGTKKIIVVNQFAYVQTNDFDGAEDKIGRYNNKAIEDSINEADIVLIAWGVANSFENRKQFVNKILSKEINRNKIVLQTKKHPSRGYYKDFLKEYRAHLE